MKKSNYYMMSLVLSVIGIASLILISAEIFQDKYNGNYVVISKTGDEEKYDVNFENIKEGVKICIAGEFKTYDDTLSLYKTEELVKYNDLEVNVLDDSGETKEIEYCYTANPLEDYYLKFGENSIIIIQITSAMHLNSTRGYIQNIFEYVNQSDDVTYTIPNNEYVRVEFEKNLTNTSKIMVETNNTEIAEVYLYEKESDVLIANATIEIGSHIETYLYPNHTGNQSTFDLKSIGNITYDYIVDPPAAPAWTGTMVDLPDPIQTGRNITYFATANDNSGEAEDPYKLIVCANDSINGNIPAPFGDCDEGVEFCRSENGTFDNEVNCQYNATSQSDGLLQAYGFLCGADGRCSIYAQATTTIDNTAPNITFEYPTPNNASSQSNDNIFVNLTLADAVGGISTFIDFDNSLMFWMRMDDLDANGEPVDYLGVNNGTAQGDAIQTDAGYLGKGFEFDGSDWIDVNDSEEIDTKLNDSFTISAWFKTNGDNNLGNNIFSKWYSYWNNISYRCLIQYNVVDRLECYISPNGVDTYKLTGTSVIPATWNQVVFVYNGTYIKLYYNGILENSTNYSSGVYDSLINLTIGRLNDYATGYFNGTIDDMMIFNRSLDYNEVYGLYANKSSEYLQVNYTGLSLGNYTFKAYTQDQAGNVNETGKRTITIEEVDEIYPLFSNYWDDNASLEDSGTGHFNVTLKNTNGTVWLDINGENITAGNLTEKVYNTSYVFSSGGVYDYKWWAYGNGTNNNINVSVNQNYTVNISSSCSYTSGNWEISDYCEFTNQDFQIDGNLSLLSGGTLNVTNGTINFTSTGQWIIFNNIADEDKLILRQYSRIN